MTLSAMRSLTFACFYSFAIALIGQGTMNVHFTMGEPMIIGLDIVDSAVYDTSQTPPVLRVFRPGLPTWTFLSTEMDSVTFSPGGAPGTPLLTTRSPMAITGSCGLVGSIVTDENANTVTSTGVCWGLNPEPTIADAVITTGIPYLSTFAVLNGLDPNTTYFARAYATNGNGTAYGNQVQFATTDEPSGSWLDPSVTYGTMTDQNGHVYPTVTIGGREWMAENLRTSTYANGATIANITADGAWSTLGTGAWCHYQNNSAFDVPYGKLYNWYAVTDARNVCPSGWHVATDLDWTSLSDSLGGWFIAGEALKSTVLWYPTNAATNTSGFSALPGGDRIYVDGTFDATAYDGYWWTATTFSTNSAWGRSMGNESISLTRTDYPKKSGFSVRCVRN
jgi:uncharacterized protein (TIGR02145 family)